MRTFKIIALSVSGKGKKIFKARETAREDEFPAGAIDNLIAGKYIEEIKPESPAVSDGASEKAKAKAEAKAAAEKAKAEEADEAARLKAEEDAEADEAAAANEKTDGLPEKNTGDSKSEKSTPAPLKNGKK